MRVLIFVDSIHIPERLICLISEVRQGITFFKASTYREAVAQVEKIKPQAVLLDMNFSGDKAIFLLRKIKQKDDKAVVIILFTVADDHKLKMCKEHGADFLFDKYLDFEKIPEVIRKITLNDDVTNNQ
jgi:DNA-binding NarL/FixJ family response regulator